MCPAGTGAYGQLNESLNQALGVALYEGAHRKRRPLSLGVGCIRKGAVEEELPHRVELSSLRKALEQGIPHAALRRLRRPNLVAILGLHLDASGGCTVLGPWGCPLCGASDAPRRLDGFDGGIPLHAP